LSDAGCGSRIIRLRRTILLLFFGEKEFETVCFGSFILKLALKWAWSAYLKAF
jgi:hypothetical protein